MNHWLLANSNSMFCGEAITVARYGMRDCGFPVVLQPKPIDVPRKVCGEIFSVDKRTLDRLDRLEGEGRMYARCFVDVLDAKRDFHRVFMYIGIAERFARLQTVPYRCIDGNGNWNWTWGHAGDMEEGT